MPCYSTIQTKLLDAEVVKKAAEAMGYVAEVSKDALSITIRKGGQVVAQITRYNVTSTFETSYQSAELVKNLTVKYAEIKVRRFAQKNGYIISKGKGVRQLVLEK